MRRVINPSIRRTVFSHPPEANKVRDQKWLGRDSTRLAGSVASTLQPVASSWSVCVPTIVVEKRDRPLPPRGGDTRVGWSAAELLARKEGRDGGGKGRKTRGARVCSPLLSFEFRVAAPREESASATWIRKRRRRRRRRRRRGKRGGEARSQRVAWESEGRETASAPLFFGAPFQGVSFATSGT